jgi:hypothetical protein
MTAAHQPSRIAAAAASPKTVWQWDTGCFSGMTDAVSTLAFDGERRMKSAG